MLLLGIDTSTRRVGVVLASERGLVARVELGDAVGATSPATPKCWRRRSTTPAGGWRHRRPSVGDRGRCRAGYVHGLRVGVTTAKVLAALRFP
jgi:hypothetical protein